MNIQEAIKRVEQMGEYERFVDEPISKKSVLNIISQIHEPKKVIVPKFVADWYEERKDYFDFNIYGFYKYFYSQGKHEEVKKWIDNAENKAIETLVKMKLYGYEVEKGKLYTVELPIHDGPLGFHYVLRKNKEGEIVIGSFYNKNWRNYDYCQLTEDEIKKDFGWAWQFAKEVEDD